MFAISLERARKYTQPLVISFSKENGSVESVIGTFVILNDEGWVITAAHMIQIMQKHNQDRVEIQEWEKKQKEIEKSTINEKSKGKKLSKHKRKRDKEWITNFSYWWASDGVRVEGDVLVNVDTDLAIAKLDGLKINDDMEFPVIKKPGDDMRIGTSLCKLGFPFHNIKTTMDNKTGNFKREPGALPIPFFPIEGIYTRNMLLKMPNGDLIKFLETSSPGLRGQSGGPIIDIEGNIWAIQSKTLHLELGFSPTVKIGNKSVIENQFLNVGVGSHSENIVKILNERNVKFNLSKT